MAALLREEQWEINGFLFGEGTNFRLRTGGLDFGSPELRVQDAARPQGDGTMIGRDYVDGPEMQFTIRAKHGLDVWTAISAFKQAWRADSVRSQPGVLSVLRYRQNGTTYRFLGRGRKFDMVPMQIKNDRRQDITATFQLAAPERYLEPEDASTRTLRLNLIQAASDGGVVLPAVLPWHLQPSSQARVGDVTVGGFRPAPFKCVVHGPVTGTMSQISLSGDGWAINTSASLTPDQTLTIDTAANTITRNGISVAGTLSRTSRLTSRLAVGHQYLTFSASDPTNTGYAVFTWFDAVPA